MTATTAMLAGCVLQVTLFSLLTAGLYLIARRVAAGAAGPLLAGSLALVLGLTLLAGSPWPRWDFSAAQRTQPSVNAAPAASTDTGQALSPPDEAPAPQGESPYAAAWEAFTTTLAAPPQGVAQGEADRPRHGVTLFWSLAAFGLVVSAGRLAWGVWQVGRLLRRSEPIAEGRAVQTLAELREQLGHTRPLALVESPDLATPATVGWRRQHVLLPAAWSDWSDDELRAALAHELAHVAAGDYRSWLVARLAVAVHFYHPLVRWLAGRLQLEQELAADAAAARLVGDRQNYLECLASLALATPPQRLAGPARTLFPSRSLLMRRVEMLRSNMGPRLGSVSGRLRGVAVGLMGLVALGVAGVRQPASVAEEPGGKPVVFSLVETPERISLSLVPADAAYAVSIRPAELLGDEAYDPLLKELSSTPDIAVMREEANVTLRGISEFLLTTRINIKNRSQDPKRIAIRFVTPRSSKPFLSWLARREGLEKQGDSPETWGTSHKRIMRLDPQTLLLDAFHGQDTPPPVRFATLPAWAEEWERRGNQQLVAAMSVGVLRQAIPAEERQQLLGGFPMQAMAPLFNHTEWAFLSAGLNDQLEVGAFAECDSEENAGRIAKMLQGLLLMGGGVFEQQRGQITQQMDGLPREEQDKLRPAAERLLTTVGDFFEKAEPIAEKNVVSLTYTTDQVSAGQAAEITAMLLPSIKAAQAAAKRTQSMNNLKQLALAMHNYHSFNGSFPPAVLYKEGSPHPYSWRVALLPYVGQKALYDAYQFDHPWDSPANQKIAETVVPVLRSPFDDPASTNTSYFVLTGAGTVFDGKEGSSYRDIRDGTSMTLQIVEAKRAVPWTKPEDIPYAADKPLPELGGWIAGGFLAAWCDGHVSLIPDETPEEQLRKLITKAGLEVVKHP